MSAASNPRTFKFISLASSSASQPLVGTTLTANVNPSQQNQTIAIADSSFFVAGDFFNFVKSVGSAGVAEPQVRVQSITDSTHIVIGPINGVHLSGDFLALFWPCANVRIEISKAAAPAGDLYIGATQSVDNTGTGAFTNLALVAFFVTPFRAVDSDNLSNYWIAGTSANDVYLPSAWTA